MRAAALLTLCCQCDPEPFDSLRSLRTGSVEGRICLCHPEPFDSLRSLRTGSVEG
jgi:hypothetical protein